MRKLNVAIADDNKLTVQLLEDIIKTDQDMNIVGEAGDGETLLKIIKNEKPDVVLLDMLMPVLDGLGIMERVKKSKDIKKPAFVIVSSYGQPNIAEDAFELGATYYMLKPIDGELMIQRIKRAGRHQNRVGQEVYRHELEQADHVLESRNLDATISYMLHEIGIPAHIKGYQYLRTAIRMVVRDITSLDGITKIMYPEIAKEYHSSSVNVERSIRHAIEIAWERGNMDTLEAFFKNSVSSAKGKPTNSEFIALIADRIRMENSNCGKIVGVRSTKQFG